MIMDSLVIMLIGMVGIFVVMGIIFISLHALHYFSKSKKGKENDV